jgi:threonine/homoserine/homoserine lactone efflux protein
LSFDVLPSASVVAGYVAAVVVLVLTPGPDMTLFLGRTLTGGRREGLAVLAGTTVGLYVHTTLVALGLAALLAASPTAFTVLKWAGAAWLVHLAIEALRHGSALAAEAGAGPAAPTPPYRAFLAGLGVNLLNPKIVVFFVTFLPQFVDPGDPHATARIAVLGGLYGVIGAPICVVLILGAEKVAGTFRRSRRLARALDVACAGLFSAFALKLVLSKA